MKIVSVNAEGAAFTTTVAISDGTDCDHASVIRLVRTYQSDLEEFGRVGFEIAPFATTGGIQKREVASLNEQQSTLILTYMRNSDIVRQFKKALVKEFFELAKKARQIDPLAALSDPATMRGLLLTYTEKVIALESKVVELAPKAEALDLIATADGMLNLQTAGKVLQQQPNKFVQWLRENGWIYKRAGSASNCARAEKYNAGYLTTKAVTVLKGDGTERVREQVMVTPKGIAKLALVLGVQPMQGAV